MKDFITIKEFTRIYENIQQSKKILADKGKDSNDPDYVKLRKLIEKTPGLAGKFTEWMYSGTPFWKLKNAHMFFLRAKNKKIKLGNIDSFNSFEEFDNDIKDGFEKQWENQFTSGIKKEVSDLFDEKIWKLLKSAKSDDKAVPKSLEYVKKFLGTHGRRYKSSKELYDVIQDELLTFRNITKNEYSQFFSKFSDEDAEIVFEDDKNLLVDIKTFKAMDAANENNILSRSYCFGNEDVWCNLIGSHDNIQQMFWFNFNLDFQDVDSLITYTVEDGEITRVGTRYGEVEFTDDWEELKEIIDEFLKKITQHEIS